MEKDHLEVLLEDISGKLDLVLKGNDILHKEIIDFRQDLSERISFVDFKVEALNQKIDGFRSELSQKIDGVEGRLSKKIDAVASDLSAHRADTEAHPPIYRIKE